MKVLILYHFFFPDTVVSARIMSDLAEDLTEKGHKITAYTSNCLIRKSERLCKHEMWNGVEIKRFSRPRFPQSSNIGRLINSFVLQIKWIWSFFVERKQYDTVIVGTDPQFVWMIFPFIKLINHKVKLIHWCFDLYPEAIMVNSSFVMKALASITKPYAFLCYRACDAIVDIGECMRNRLKKYVKSVEYHTLTPWALKETCFIPEPDPIIREDLFGKAKVGLLYSGTVGYAHDITPFIELARECRKKGIDAAFCFAGYGNCYQEQTSIITEEDTNIRLAGFASEEELEKRLAAADIHLVSLREGWEGIVVPSKFFGSLAIGRPVIFSGPTQSSIYIWCKEYNAGIPLDEKTASFLKQVEEDSSIVESLKKNAYGVYHEQFSKDVICKRWSQLV
jgi:glycosyltransferase involved in cell wall biosynthesis